MIEYLYLYKLRMVYFRINSRCFVYLRHTDRQILLLSLATIYRLPKLRSTELTEKKYEDEPIFIEVFERKEGEHI